MGNFGTDVAVQGGLVGMPGGWGGLLDRKGAKEVSKTGFPKMIPYHWDAQMVVL